MATSNWGVEFADGADAGNVPAAMGAMQESIEGRFVADFATVAARATATTAHLADFPGATGMVAYVTDRGMCVYDGNARSGSGGWTWLAQPVKILDMTNFSGTSGSGTLATIASGGAYNLSLGSFNRRVLVQMWTKMWNASGTLTAPAKADTLVLRNGGELRPVSVGCLLLPTGTGTGLLGYTNSDTYLSASWEYVWSGTTNMSVQLRRETGGSGSVSTDGYLQVIDMGPAD